MAKKLRRRPAHERVNPIPESQVLRPQMTLREWVQSAPARYMTRGEFVMWLQGFEQQLSKQMVNLSLVEDLAVATSELLVDRHLATHEPRWKEHVDSIGEKTVRIVLPEEPPVEPPAPVVEKAE